MKVQGGKVRFPSHLCQNIKENIRCSNYVPCRYISTSASVTIHSVKSAPSSVTLNQSGGYESLEVQFSYHFRSGRDPLSDSWVAM